MKVTQAWLGLMLVAVLANPATAEESSVGSSVEQLVHFFSPEFRRIEQRIQAIETELESLPGPKREAWGSRYGHRSADLTSQTQPDWLQVDFGESRRVDTLVLMPAVVGYAEDLVDGYGFPKQFRVELADNPEMEDAVTVVAQNQEIENPGRHPLVFRIPPTEGRYLRFTSLKHVANADGFFWAIEEIMALDGNQSVEQAQTAIASSSTTLFPLWSPVRAFDGQSRLGMPVDVTVESPSKGYLSASLPLAEANELPHAGTWKWSGVDLGEVHRVELIRMLPIELEEYWVFGGRGFPRSYRIELALDKDFEQIVWQTQIGSLPLGFPSGWMIRILVPDVEARYVRVVATRMWTRDNHFIFGLAELQVYGDNRNLARGKPVLFKDRMNLPPSSGWAPEYLTDGYTSRYRLIEWPEYLGLLEARALLERELSDLLDIRRAKLLAGKGIFTFLIRFLVLLVLGVIACLIWRQRSLQRQALQRLREQIARDLHDDIGSNLGGIVLLSEVGRDTSTDEESQEDFRAIHEAAEQASSSMRDIVWLVQREQVGLKEMIKRMREIAEMLLSQSHLEFTVQPLDYKDRNLSLFFRRHVFLAFKESCNNVRKHAQAKQVDIRIEIATGSLQFQVRDDGAGFDTKQVLATGCGLGNLRRRASRLKGTVQIESASGKGTTITFEAPFRT